MERLTVVSVYVTLNRILYTTRLTYTHKYFITNKLHFSVNRKPLLRVSEIIYSHLRRVQKYILKDTYSVTTQRRQTANGKIHSASTVYKPIVHPSLTTYVT